MSVFNTFRRAPRPGAQLTFRVQEDPGSLINKYEAQVLQGDRRVGWLQTIHDTSGKSLFINEVELDSSLRGMGLGKKMHYDIFEHAKKLGMKEVFSGSVVSDSEQNVWRSLMKEGLPITEAAGAGGATFTLDVAKFATAHKPQIEGLIEKGAACAMRKIASSFGSGWQGLEPGFTVKTEDMGSSVMMKLMKGEQEAGYLMYERTKGGIAKIGSTQIFDEFRGSGHGRSLYRAAAEHAKSTGMLYFRSDVQGKVEPSAVKAWKAGMEAMPGVIEPIAGEQGTYLMKLTKLMMDKGEGAAIGKAGTSMVPAVIRGTARVIKNAL